MDAWAGNLDGCVGGGAPEATRWYRETRRLGLRSAGAGAGGFSRAGVGLVSRLVTAQLVFELGERAFGDAQPIVDVFDAGHVVSQVFGAVLHAARWHAAFLGDFTLRHAHLDVAGVDLVVQAQPVGHVFANALVAANVAFGAATSEATALTAAAIAVPAA